MKQPETPVPGAEEGITGDIAAPAPAGPLPDRAPSTPAEDPLFQKAKAEVRTESRRQRKHPPAERKRQEAADAAALTEGEQIEQSAKEKSTAEMERVGSAQQGEAKRFSAEGFKKELMDKVDAKKPHDEGEAKALARTPPLENFEQGFAGKVAQEQGKVTGPLEKRAREKPSGGEVEKPVVGIPKPVPPPVPQTINPRLAAPKPKAWWEISLQRESDRLDEAMRENRLSEQQLADSREPSFIETLEVKREAQRRAAEAPEVYRQKESALLDAAQGEVDKSLSGELNDMSMTQRRSRIQVFSGQEKTETQTEKRQREIKQTIDGIYDDTVRDVKALLEGMAAQVKDDLAKALREKTDEFNSEVRRRISDYYGDWRIDDDLFGPDDVIVEKDGSTRAMTFEEKFSGAKRINPDVYRIFVQEKNRFVRAMDQALDVIANNVQTGLTSAHNRIQAGEAGIAIFKATLKGEELAYAGMLEQEVKLKFETLEASIDDTREDLLQTLSDQYSENVAQLEKTFNEINDELKKGWLERAAEFIKTVGKTIFQLADLLLTILVRMAHLIWDIVRHPIRFFETLVSGLMQGIRNFIDNIGTYMQEAFWTWVTGTTSARGIRLSSGSGAESLFGIVLQVLSLTPADLRASAEKVLGKEFMQLFDKGQHLAEKALEPVTILLTKGPGALWQHLRETLADTVQSSFNRIRQSVFGAFIEKALKWIAGFFVPGGGFVKVVKAVLRAFQFVAENLERIRHFFNAVFDSMEAAVRGKTEGVASKIIVGLRMGIALALDFLARQIGLNAIVSGVQRILQALRRPIVTAIEWLLAKIRPFAVKLTAKVKELAAKALGGDAKAPPEQRLRAGLREATQAVNRLSGSRIALGLINPLLSAIRLRHNMQRLEAQPRGAHWVVVGVVNPTDEELTNKLVDEDTPGAEKREYRGVNAAGFATMAKVIGLRSLRPQNEPTAVNARWNILAKRLNRHGGSTYYVRGHMINGVFGGPGDDWRNLTPLTQRANNSSIASMLRTFENPVRDAVQKRAKVDLSVRAVYGQPSRTADAASARAGTKPRAEKEAVARLIEVEQSVPSEIEAKAHIIARSGAEQDLTSNTANVIDRNLLNYFHVDYPPAGGAVARRQINLNTATRPELMSLVGVTQAVAQQIEGGRLYATREDFTNRLGSQLWHSMVSTAGVSLRF